MRFLAHGGAGRAERARVGDWPEIPSGLLLDVRGLSADAPAFGLGVLQGRPYLIYRELQGDDGESVNAYTFLLEPRPEDFELYRWNGAWLLASLLADADACSLLLDEPELATEHSLAHALDRCNPIPLTREASPEILAALLARAALESDRITAVSPGVSLVQPTPLMDFAAALHRVPIAFRTGRGWLVRGVGSHAAILGCGLLFEGPTELSSDPGPGLAALARLEHIAATNMEVAELLATPWPQWDARGQSLMHGLRMLEQLETRTVQGWDLLQSVPAREGLLKAEIRTAALRTMERSRMPLPFEPTTMLIEDAEAGNRTLTPDVIARLDHGALLRFFTTRGVPPAPWPDWMETPHTLKAELWTRQLEAAKDGWPDHARRALADLVPGGEPDAAAFAVVAAGIAAARAAGQSPFEWESFTRHPELRSLLSDWSLENVKKMRGDWQAAYLALGEDPGGHALAKGNIAAPVAARLVTYMWDALAGPRSNKARVWLHALATSPLRDIVPMATKVQLAATAGGPWTRLEQMRLAWEGDVVSGEPAPAEERPYLLRELELLTQNAPMSAPKLNSLRAVIGADLPEPLLRSVSRWTKPGKIDPQTSGGWFKSVSQKLKDAASAMPQPEARPKREPKAKPEKPKYEPPKQQAKPRDEARPKPEPMPKPKPNAAPAPPVREPERVAKKGPRISVPPPPPPRPVMPARPRPADSMPMVPEPNVIEPREMEPLRPAAASTPMPKRVEPLRPVAASPPPAPAPKAAESQRPIAPSSPSPPAQASPPTHQAAPAGVEPVVRVDLRERLRVWIAGGNTVDDRTGDEELLKLFEHGNATELAAARTIIEGFSAGLLYRLAGRSIANPRLLDACARVLGVAVVDRIVRDSLHYDIVRFSKAAAARLALNHADGWQHPVDQAILRVLRAGHAELRQELNRELRESEPGLLDDLARAIDPPAASSDAA